MPVDGVFEQLAATYYFDANCCKMSAIGIFSYSEIKNIILINNNVDISTYSSEPQVHIWTWAVNGLNFGQYKQVYSGVKHLLLYIER